MKANVSPFFLLEDLSFFGLTGIARPNLEHHLYEPAMKVPLVLPDRAILPERFQDPYMPPDTPLRAHFRYFSDGVRASTELLGSNQANGPFPVVPGRKVPPKRK